MSDIPVSKLYKDFTHADRRHHDSWVVQASDILADTAAAEEPGARQTLKKKDKQALKHDLFLQRESLWSRIYVTSVYIAPIISSACI